MTRYRLKSFGYWLAASALVAALSAAAAQAQGKPDFEFHRDLGPGKRFYLSDIMGDVTVTGGSGRTVEVTAIKRTGRHGEPVDVTIETIELMMASQSVCVIPPHRKVIAEASRLERRIPAPGKAIGTTTITAMTSATTPRWISRFEFRPGSNCTSARSAATCTPTTWKAT